MGMVYKSVPKVKDIKYKGTHPLEKRKFIKELNEKITEFNEYWEETSSDIQGKISDLFDPEIDTESIKKLLKKSGVNMSEKDIKNAIEDSHIVFNIPNYRKVVSEISEEYCDDLKSILEKVAKTQPKETLEEKKEYANNFFEEFFEKETRDEINLNAEKLISHSLAKELKPFVKRAKSEKKKKIIALIDKLLRDIEKNDNMSSNAKKKSVSSLKAARKSFSVGSTGAVQKKDIPVLRATISAISENDPTLRRKFLQQQHKAAAGNTQQKTEAILNGFTMAAESSKVSSSGNISAATEKLTQKIDPPKIPPAPNTKKAPSPSELKKPKKEANTDINKNETYTSESETARFEKILQNARKNLKHVDKSKLK